MFCAGFKYGKDKDKPTKSEKVKVQWKRQDEDEVEEDEGEIVGGLPEKPSPLAPERRDITDVGGNIAVIVPVGGQEGMRVLRGETKLM